MLQMLPQVLPISQTLAQNLPPPYWQDAGFWISSVLGIGGLLFSVLAWLEARGAKRAATAAGRTVKLQTLAIELTEIIQKLDKVQPGIRYSEARDLIAEASRRVHRATSPFVNEAKLSETIRFTKEAIDASRISLAKVRPTEASDESEAPNAVYNGIEADCTAIANAVSDLLGLFEKQAFDFGEKNDGKG